MLPDRLCQLLTAYVDGELPARQERAVQQLLERSPEARTLLGQLQADAERVRSLPRRALGRDLVPQLLQTIADLPPREPALRRRPALPSTMVPVWAGWVLAASVLLVVGMGSYLYFAVVEQAALEVALVSAPAAADPELPELIPAPRALDVVSAVAAPAVAVPAKPGPAENEPIPPPATVAKKPEAPENNAPAAPVNTAPGRVPEGPMFKEIADPRLAVLLSVRELDLEKPRQRLHEELQKDVAYRVELSCVESVRAFERVQGSFKAQGIQLVIDEDAQSLIKLRLKRNYVLYIENITPAEIVRLLEHLAREERAAEAKRPGDRQLDRVIVNRMTAGDHKELSKLLGIDPTQLQRPRSNAPLGVDIRKPVSSTTTDQVVQTLQGQGPPRPEPGKPIVMPSDGLGIVLADRIVRPRAASQEVKQFLDKRKEPRAGTIQVLLVLRGSNS